MLRQVSTAFAKHNPGCERVNALTGELGQPWPERRERDLEVDRSLELDAGNRRHALDELHAGSSVSRGDLRALPERKPDRFPFLREHQEPVEAVDVTQPS